MLILILCIFVGHASCKPSALQWLRWHCALKPLSAALLAGSSGLQAPASQRYFPMASAHEWDAWPALAHASAPGFTEDIVVVL